MFWYFNKEKRPHLWIIVIGFSVMTFVLLDHFGLRVVNDSRRYLAYADNLRRGLYIDPHNIWYISYAFFILVIHLVTRDPTGIVIVQIALSLGGVLALRQLVLLATEKEISATIAALLYMCFYEVLLWNNYVLTESLYLSATCISLWLLARTVYCVGRKRRWTLVIAAVVFTALLKPTGVALVGAVVVSLCYLVIQRNSLRYPWLLIAAVSIVFLLLVNAMLGTFQVIEDYAKGEIIYDITTLPVRPEYQTLHIHPPADLFIPSLSLPPLAQIIVFIVHNPVFWLKLFFTKLYYFAFHIRPYWSWVHNAYVLFYLIPVYAFAIFTLLQGRLPMAVRLFCWAYTGLHLLSICFTSVDWDGRFLMPVLPLLFALAAPRITVVLHAVKAGIKHE